MTSTNMFVTQVSGIGSLQEYAQACKTCSESSPDQVRYLAIIEVLMHHAPVIWKHGWAR